jgi:hypothetical protein
MFHAVWIFVSLKILFLFYKKRKQRYCFVEYLIFVQWSKHLTSSRHALNFIVIQVFWYLRKCIWKFADLVGHLLYNILLDDYSFKGIWMFCCALLCVLSKLFHLRFSCVVCVIPCIRLGSSRFFFANFFSWVIFFQFFILSHSIIVVFSSLFRFTSCHFKSFIESLIWFFYKLSFLSHKNSPYIDIWSQVFHSLKHEFKCFDPIFFQLSVIIPDNIDLLTNICQLILEK